MRSSNKSRSRNKNTNNNRRGNTGNIVNRVFDSAGPEGKVRGTPQQIIEKYLAMSHDALMSGDRIASENFAQYAEHYTRLLGNAQREIAERREAQEAQQRRENEIAETPAEAKKVRKAPAESDEQPDVSAASGKDLFPADGEESNLVETPENAEKPAKKPAPRKRKAAAKPAAVEAQPAASEEQIIN